MGKKISKNQSILIYCTIAIILLSSSFCAILFYPQKNKNNHATVSIRSGFTLGQISNLLYEKKILSNRKMFELAALLMGKEKEFPVGTFQIINPNSNYDIINQLVNESPEIIKVRILEGWDARKIASYLAEVMRFDSTLVM